MGWLAAATIAAPVVGGLMNKMGVSAQNTAAKDRAREQMNWQERMSSSAHQRQVSDLKAAGLNPILSANTGASTPSGAMAPVQNEQEGMAQSAMQALTSALELKRLKKDISLADQEIKNKKAQENQTKTQTTLLKATEPAARMVNKIGKEYESVTNSAKSIKRHIFEKSNMRKAEQKAKKSYKKSQAYKDARRKRK